MRAALAPACAPVFAVILAALVFPADAATIPRPFTATYEVSYRGIHAGTLTFKLTRDAANGRYIYETRANPSALARLVVSRAALERSVMEIGPDGVRPLEWSVDDGKSGDQGDGFLQFDWVNGVVSGRIEGEDVRLPTEPNLQDRLSIQIAVVDALLNGGTPSAYPLIDDNRVKRYTYTKKEPARVDSKLGALDTIIYESTRAGSSRVSRFWLTPQFEYAAARAEQVRKGKVETVMTLISYEADGG
jgi:Protein of unknown function (DUF3108)